MFKQIVLVLLTLILFGCGGGGGGSAESVVTVDVTFMIDSNIHEIVTIDKNNTIGSKMPVKPSREGFIFLGWSTDSLAKTVNFYENSPVTTHTTVYVVWLVPENHSLVKFIDNNTIYHTISIQDNTAIGSKFPSNPLKTGYRFLGWSTVKNSSITDFNSTSIISSDMIVYAVWVAVYNVTYKDTTDIADNLPSQESVDGSTIISLPNLTTTKGYIFKGWRDEGSSTLLTGMYTVNKNLSLQAVWEGTLSFDANGKGTAPSAYNVEVGKAVILPSISVSGSYFKGWSESPNGSIVSTSYIFKKNTVLYAIWKDGINITFTDTHGIAPVPAAIVAEKGTDVALPELTAHGYKFLGWRKAAGQEPVKNINSLVNVQLDAVWGASVTYVTDYGVIPEAFTAEIGTSVPLPTLTHGTITFKGWSLSAGGSVLGSYTLGQNVTLYALWKVYYTVKFKDSSGKYTGTMPADVTVESGTVITLPILTQSNYIFRGWKDSYWVSDSYTVTKNVILDTVWAATVTFISAHTEVAPEQCIINDSCYLQSPYHSSYLFKHWSLTEDGEPIDKPFSIDRDTTLYAVWTPGYRIIFNFSSYRYVDIPAGETLKEEHFPQMSGNFFGWFTGNNGGGEQIKPGYKPTKSITVNAAYSFWNEGSGVDGDPFIIKTVTDLDNIRLLLGAYFKLENNLDLGNYNQIQLDTSCSNSRPGCKDGKGWHPIDDFSGNFDGAGHTIYNMTTNDFSTWGAGALFGKIINAKISSVKLESVNLDTSFIAAGIAKEMSGNSIIDNCFASGNIKSERVGGIAVYMNDNSSIINSYANVDIKGEIAGGITAYIEDNSSIINSYTNVDIKGEKAGGIAAYVNDNSSIINSYANVDIKGENSDFFSYLGGIAGDINDNGTIDSCFSAGVIIGYGYVGGIAGEAEDNAKISNSYSTTYLSSNKDTGGIFGRGNGQVTNSYFSGALSTTSNSYSSGGIAGYAAGAKISKVVSMVSYIKSQPNIGSLVGKSSASGSYNGYAWDKTADWRGGGVKGTNKTAAELSNKSTYEGLGWDFTDKWQMGLTGPILKWQKKGSGTAEDPYMIYTVKDLDYIRKDLNKHYKLAADLDMTGWGRWGSNSECSRTTTICSDGNYWLPIGDSSNKFEGSFDGNGYKIQGLQIDRTSQNIGLFGVLGNSGVLKNIIISGNVKGVYYAGMLVGDTYGTIDKVSVNGNITGDIVGGISGVVSGGKVSNVFSSGKVEQVAYGIAGGITGKMDAGEIDSSLSKMSVKAQSAGGIVGKLTAGTIKNSVAVNSSIISTLNFLGKAGRIVGDNAGEINNCIGHDTMPVLYISTPKVIVSNANGEDGLDKSAAELSNIETYKQLNWNFSNVWLMGNDSPNLNFTK